MFIPGTALSPPLFLPLGGFLFSFIIIAFPSPVGDYAKANEIRTLDKENFQSLSAVTFIFLSKAFFIPMLHYSAFYGIIRFKEGLIKAPLHLNEKGGVKELLYNNLSGYLRKSYGKRMKKICIDGGFSCPNRDGKCGTGGCIYCGDRGAGEHIEPTRTIREQVLAALDTARPDDLFIAYFQSFTNTYAPTDVLRERYDAALIDGRIKILAIGTRPDCIDDDICRLLAEYARKYEVWVELGLQTASDETARTINRGYTLDVFERALQLLKEYKIKTVVHTIIGLPGEDVDDVKATADYLAKKNLFGIKIHSIYVMRSTKLAQIYEQNLYTPPTLDEFCEGAAYMLSHISPDVVVHRLTGDCPKGELLAPEWNENKNDVLDAIRNKMERDGLVQGSLYCE